MIAFKELLLRAKRGEEKAFEELFAIFEPLVRKCSIVNGHVDEDLRQILLIHPHMFRHTFVSLLMSNPDIGVATVAAEAGHAQPSTTLMIYTQQYKKRRESIRNQLSRELYEK